MREMQLYFFISIHHKLAHTMHYMEAGKRKITVVIQLVLRF